MKMHHDNVIELAFKAVADAPADCPRPRLYDNENRSPDCAALRRARAEHFSAALLSIVEYMLDCYFSGVAPEFREPLRVLVGVPGEEEAELVIPNDPAVIREKIMKINDAEKVVRDIIRD